MSWMGCVPGEKCFSLTSCDFVSPGVMVEWCFLLKELALHWGLYSGVGSFGGGGFVIELVVIAGNRNAVRYREGILLSNVVPFLQAYPCMTMPPAILLILCVISCKTGMSVFYHGQTKYFSNSCFSLEVNQALVIGFCVPLDLRES